MRIITDKDKRGLLIAFRTFMRPLTGERIAPTQGLDMIEKAVSAGVTFDELLNRANYLRAAETNPRCLADEYVDALCSRSILGAGTLKDETGWHENAGGFAVVAEAAHDFFMEITGRGGKWNIPTALTNLAKGIRAHSLEAILSEKLINEVCGEGEDALNYFAYIQAIAKDFDSLPVDDSQTEAEETRSRETEAFLDTVTEEQEPVEGDLKGQNGAEEPDPGQETEFDDPDLEPFPIAENESEQSGFQTVFLSQNNPRDYKKDCIRNAIGNYSPMELMGLIRTIEGGENLTVSDIIDKITDGAFNVSLESPDTRQMHMSICGDLMPSFIECVRMQGIEMDEDLATRYDILHDSWDLRDASVRKVHKLKKLIYTCGEEDQDLLDVIQDIERFYSAD